VLCMNFQKLCYFWRHHGSLGVASWMGLPSHERVSTNWGAYLIYGTGGRFFSHMPALAEAVIWAYALLIHYSVVNLEARATDFESVCLNLMR